MTDANKSQSLTPEPKFAGPTTTHLGRTMFPPFTLQYKSGFEWAKSYQVYEACKRTLMRLVTRGSVAKRHGKSLSAVRVGLQDLMPATVTETKSGVKIFKGFTPPKRGARTGDLYMRGDAMAVCIGWNLWEFKDGHRLRLQGKGWVTIPATNMDAVD